jgi:methionine aminotransferase
MRSKLPDVGTTIFTIQSRRAQELGALNIGQGFPDFPIDPRLAAHVSDAMRENHNQYAPMAGVLDLRQAIAAKLEISYGIKVDPLEEITVSCGGTEALFSTIQAVISPGDEVIVFDPAYDAYEPAVRLAGGRCHRLPLLPPGFRIDWQRVRELVGPKTRLIVLNNPHNPACSIASRTDLDELAAVLRDRDAYVLADEVYEHCVYDGARHASVLTHPELRERSFAVFSFGKSLHITGWRVGYCVAPPELTREFRKVHQYNSFAVASPLQVGIARHLRATPESWQGLAAFFTAKRDALRAALANSAFKLPPSAGTYFQLLDFSALSSASDVEFCEQLMLQAGVATIPLSPFYREPLRLQLLRICIAKSDQTLAKAAEKLASFARTLAVSA